MSISESNEMYLETIYILEDAHGHAHVSDIASRLGVKKPSVSKAMEQLKKENLIYQESYGPVTLTERGKKVSKLIYRKHHLITRFLEKSLNLGYDEASQNACRMEHNITDDMLEAIEKYLESET